MPTVTLVNPDAAAFENAVKILTGKTAVHPGRSNKVLGLVRSNYDGSAVFGTCDVGWIGEHGNKRVVISTADATLNLQLVPRVTGKNLSLPSAVLVSEHVGGIFAYLNDHAKAAEVAKALNVIDEADPEGEERPYYVLDFDEDHTADYERSLATDALLVIHQDNKLIGYAIVENPETVKLYVV